MSTPTQLSSLRVVTFNVLPLAYNTEQTDQCFVLQVADGRVRVQASRL